MSARTAILLIWAVMICAVPVARAHQVNLTTARLTIESGNQVVAEVAMKGSDADRVAQTKVFDDRTGMVSPDALAAASGRITAYVNAHAVVAGVDGSPCRPDAGSASPDGDGVVVRTTWSCDAVAGRLKYRSTMLLDVAPDARQVVLIGTGADAAQDLLDARRTETTLTETAEPTTLQVMGRYLQAGVEHIFLGYDHIAFLAAVVLWARRLVPVIKIVTAFTIAHSITLSLAALDIVRVPSAIIEPAIAASIVYVAAENFLSRRVDGRWRDTFCFGLIHGFGFASALQEFGLPRSAVVPALASFNIGVEIGQIAIVSLVLPLLLALDRVLASRTRTVLDPRRPALAVYAISAVIIGLGSYWFLARTVLPA
ncbi:MAG TPA: HupE/UreJ family protein [Acetobacteraceae bacterium]|nr:HupE/UreJ family protein [Acetobacteraceae bacterium]